MLVACPHCHELIESTGPPPASCGHCGGALPRRGGASDVTVDYSPEGDRGDAEVRGTTAIATPHDRGRRVGDYRLLRLLGEGGMGVVWEAEQAETGRRVALKLISPSLQPTPETVDRFLREGQLAASVSHPRSTFVFGAGEEDGQPYIAMELMPGQTLKDMLDREGPLPVERAVDCILDIIDGLEAAHAQGVIHRDVKPSNCFLDGEGRVKVGDFGLSKSLVSDAELTRTGAFLGTPQFAAPEQVRGGAVTPATDAYAVGATLFCLLTGRGPFVGDAVGVIAQITSDPAPPLRSLRPGAPRTLEKIVSRTLGKDPGRRFADLAQLRQALVPFATGGSSIADVGRRLAAYMLDEVVVGFVMTLTTMIGFVLAPFLLARSYPGLIDPRRLAAFVQIVDQLLIVGYFAFTEARWGRGLGKFLMGLRVLGPDGEHPDYARSLLRAIFVPGALGLIVLAPVLALVHGPHTTQTVTRPNLTDLTEWLVSLLPVGFALLCTITMRARNGYRGLHELVSGTRVVRPRRLAAGRFKRLPVVAPVATEGPASFGPFRLVGDLGRSGALMVRQGRDVLLARSVWIYEGPDAASAFTAPRRAVARAARPHWLQGGQSGGRRWDAFEAALGAPLFDVVGCGGGQWHQSRTWLLDLAEELAAAAADETLPPSLSLDQIWITRGGRVKLLDAAISPLRAEGSSTDSPFARLPAADNPFAPMSAEGRAIALLRQAVALCTGGQLLPAHVRVFADELAARPPARGTLDWAVARLRDVTRQPTALGWDDRLGILAVTMGTEMSVYFGAAFSLVWFVTDTLRWSDSAIAATAALAWLLPAIVGFAFRGGPAFWLTGIDVLDTHGRRASRWRCAWRNLVAWTAMTLPYAIMAAVASRMVAPAAFTGGPTPDDVSSVLEPTFWIFMTGLCSAVYLGGIFCLGVVYALFRPRRGLQDSLAGTYLMPR